MILNECKYAVPFTEGETGIQSPCIHATALIHRKEEFKKGRITIYQSCDSRNAHHSWYCWSWTVHQLLSAHQETYRERNLQHKKMKQLWIWLMMQLSVHVTGDTDMWQRPVAFTTTYIYVQDLAQNFEILQCEGRVFQSAGLLYWAYIQKKQHAYQWRASQRQQGHQYVGFRVHFEHWLQYHHNPHHPRKEARNLAVDSQ